MCHGCGCVRWGLGRVARCAAEGNPPEEDAGLAPLLLALHVEGVDLGHAEAVHALQEVLDLDLAGKSFAREERG
jgi:hypothetical protein